MDRRWLPLVAFLLPLAACYPQRPPETPRDAVDGAIAEATGAYRCDDVSIDEGPDEYGVWLRVCGWRRRYIRDGNWWNEIAVYATPIEGYVPPADEGVEQIAPPQPYSGQGAWVPPSSGSVHVRGYRRRDGTYVRPHTRSRPR
jgi:hypothetical protein